MPHPPLQLGVELGLAHFFDEVAPEVEGGIAEFETAALQGRHHHLEQFQAGRVKDDEAEREQHFLDDGGVDLYVLGIPVVTDGCQQVGFVVAQMTHQ